MLSKPGVKETVGKVGTRYETAVAVAKLARRISEKRIEDLDPDITDPVDVATEEIADGKVKVSKTVKDVVNQDVIVEDIGDNGDIIK